jgi:hypothetical protein
MVPAVTLTLHEAAQVLNPPMTEHQLALIIRALGWKPDGYHRPGTPGHPFAAYDATRIMQLHQALLPFLE